MKTPTVWVSMLALAAALAGCREPSPGMDPDGPLELPDAWPPARDDLVPPVGTAGALDVATWNLENFPRTGATPRVVAELIRSLGLDLVAVQEIADRASFEELVGRLPEHDGVLSTHYYGDGSYQKVGFVYRRDLVEVTGLRLLYEDEAYVFPRPPLEVTARLVDGSRDFVAITVHLKAGTGADRERRARATELLEAHVRGLVDGPGDDEVLVLGDFNEVLTTSSGRATLSPWLSSPERYRMRTQVLADQDEASFLPSGVILDHVVSTAALDDELAGDTAEIPLLHLQVGDYEGTVSDHLPVVVSMEIL